MTQALDIVLKWQTLANEKNIPALMEASQPDITLIGPRGCTSGRQVLGEWIERAGLVLENQRGFARGEVVVLMQHGTWRSDGDIIGEADVATVFRVEDGRVAWVARFDALDEALAEAGLSDADAVEI